MLGVARQGTVPGLSCAIPVTARDAWSELAAILHREGPAPCEETADPDAWWPEVGRNPDDVVLRACTGCPAVDACLAYALAAGEDDGGVWGGLTERQRRRLRRELEMPKPGVAVRVPQHGSASLYTLGCRCQRCRRANARKVADWRHRKALAEPLAS